MDLSITWISVLARIWFFCITIWFFQWDVLSLIFIHISSSFCFNFGYYLSILNVLLTFSCFLSGTYDTLFLWRVFVAGRYYASSSNVGSSNEKFPQGSPVSRGKALLYFLLLVIPVTYRVGIWGVGWLTSPIGPGQIWFIHTLVIVHLLQIFN